MNLALSVALYFQFVSDIYFGQNLATFMICNMLDFPTLCYQDSMSESRKRDF